MNLRDNSGDSVMNVLASMQHSESALAKRPDLSMANEATAIDEEPPRHRPGLLILPVAMR